MTAEPARRDSVRPVPDASRFQKGAERRPWRGRSTWTTVPDWRALTGDELDALPVGTRRTVAFVPGEYVGLVRTHEGWTLLARHRIQSDALAGLRSAPRVLMDPEEPPATTGDER